MDKRELKVSEDGTHHTLDGAPAYSRRYYHVEKFHPPGLAPVLDKSGAYHIRETGKPAYERRFLRIFGFYEGRAAVVSGEGWHHIRPDGSDLYSERYSWAGNFQEGRCTVRGTDRTYVYIDSKGARVGSDSYLYAGDFRDHVAVVRGQDGLCTHINMDGKPVHGKRFLDLDVYHKGYARARDSRGWFHVDSNGDAAYSERFAEVEPFYNGFAYVRDFSSRVGIVGENGKWIHTVASASLDERWNQLSCLLTGHWKTQIVSSAVRLGIVEALTNGPVPIGGLREDLDLDPEGMKRLVRALQVLGVVQIEDGDRVRLTDVGKLLAADEDFSLREASLSWSEWNYDAWSGAADSVRDGLPSFDVSHGKPFFDWIEEHREKAHIYHNAMARYATYDYRKIPDAHDFSEHECLMDVGGGKGILLSTILRGNENLRGVLFDLESAIANAKRYLSESGVIDRCELIGGDFFEGIPEGADAMILSRVIHDWDDAKAGLILSNCWKSLQRGGTLYLLELVMSDDPLSELGVLVSLNNFVMLGGKERTLKEYVELLGKSGFEFVRVLGVSPVSSLLIFEKGR